MSDELKPCPFCKSGCLYETQRNGYCDATATMFCNSCKAIVTWEQVEEEGVNEKTRQFVRERWNTRADDAPEQPVDNGADVVAILRKYATFWGVSHVTNTQCDSNWEVTTMRALADMIERDYVRRDSIADNATINEKHVPSLKELTEDTQALSDSREQLESDVRESYETGMPIKAKVLDWLDRQASITERELCDRCSPYATAKDYLDTIDSLTAERDHFRKHVNWLIDLIADIARKQPHTFDPEAPYETLDTIGDYLDELQGDVASLRAERDGLRKQLAGKQHVIDVQRDSFRKMEAELSKAKIDC